MSAVELRKDLGALRFKIHEVKDTMHCDCHLACLGPKADHYKEDVIDLTVKMDEIKEDLGEPIEMEY